METIYMNFIYETELQRNTDGQTDGRTDRDKTILDGQ